MQDRNCGKELSVLPLAGGATSPNSEYNEMHIRIYTASCLLFPKYIITCVSIARIRAAKHIFDYNETCYMNLHGYKIAYIRSRGDSLVEVGSNTSTAAL
jgi:hypothetical protein